MRDSEHSTNRNQQVTRWGGSRGEGGVILTLRFLIWVNRNGVDWDQEYKVIWGRELRALRGLRGWGLWGHHPGTETADEMSTPRFVPSWFPGPCSPKLRLENSYVHFDNLVWKNNFFYQPPEWDRASQAWDGPLVLWVIMRKTNLVLNLHNFPFPYITADSAKTTMIKFLFLTPALPARRILPYGAMFMLRREKVWHDFSKFYPRSNKFTNPKQLEQNSGL